MTQYDRTRARPGLEHLEFFVPGRAATQGSKNPVTMRESSPTLHEWRDAVTVIARAARAGRWPTIEAPGCVRVVVTFYLARPRSGVWAAAAYPGFAKDLDKLQRALGDAMKTAGVYCDDGQIADWFAAKRFASVEQDPGVRVVVFRALPGEGLSIRLRPGREAAFFEYERTEVGS